MSMDLQPLRFTDSDFKFITELVSNHAGIHLNGSKRELVYGRLARRVRRLGFDSFRAYCDLIKDAESEEFTQCVNAITTNVTSFFRERHHFDYLAASVLPGLIEKYEHGAEPRLRIWSAGCSSGEEPYSIGITIKEFTFPEKKWDVKILATDLDSNILKQASSGIYQLEQLDKLRPLTLKRWFRKGVGKNQGLASISPEIKACITFRQLNLTAEPWPMGGPFDVIFCRNVIIYFEKPVRKKLLNRFADLLIEGGHLFVGHSESLFGLTDRFQALGKTVHRKIT